MNPVKINPIDQTVGPNFIKRPEIEPKPKGESFGQFLKSAVNDVNELQKNSVAMEEKFLKGEITDVHQVMLASEQASVAFELLMEIRNKLLDSYREIIRTPA